MLNTMIHILELQKENNILSQDISISSVKVFEIHVFSDEGRLQRPLFLAENLPSSEDIRTKSFFNWWKRGKSVIWIPMKSRIAPSP